MNNQKTNILLIILSFIAILIAFMVGRYDVPIIEIIKILINKIIPIFENPTWTITMEKIILNIRLPRILLAFLVGCALSAAGAAYQGVFQNPMASPDLLGASSGACFGAALAIIWGLKNEGIIFFAFMSGLFAILIVLAVSKRMKGRKIINILLCGIMIGSLFTSCTSYLKLTADPYDELPAITYWIMGSLAGTSMKDVLFIIIPMAIGLIVLMLIRWKINLLTIGEEDALSMGINTENLTKIVIFASTLLTASAVSVSGMIGWVGLVVPHISRKLVGNDYRVLMPASILIGGIFLVCTDMLARTLLVTELPIGILTSLIGAPFFLYLMIKRGV